MKKLWDGTRSLAVHQKRTISREGGVSIHWSECAGGRNLGDVHYGGELATRVELLEGTRLYFRGSDGDIRPTNLREFYRTYLAGAAQGIQYSPNGQEEHFLACETLPYWFDYSDYLTVIYHSVLNQLLPERQLRFHLDLFVQVQFCDSRTSRVKRDQILVSQLSDQGMILNLTPAQGKELSEGDSLEIYFRFDLLEQMGQMGLREIDRIFRNSDEGSFRTSDDQFCYSIPSGQVHTESGPILGQFGQVLAYVPYTGLSGIDESCYHFDLDSIKHAFFNMEMEIEMHSAA